MKSSATSKPKRAQGRRDTHRAGRERRRIFLLLDGVLSVEVDGKTIAEVGPGAILGARALVESGHRTATLRAVTPAKAVVASADDIEPAALEELAAAHRREEA